MSLGKMMRERGRSDALSVCQKLTRGEIRGEMDQASNGCGKRCRGRGQEEEPRRGIRKHSGEMEATRTMVFGERRGET